ncbi:hypothetical protein BH11PSE11_BH11PSE11_07930 [soil metagenome]
MRAGSSCTPAIDVLHSGWRRVVIFSIRLAMLPAFCLSLVSAPIHAAGSFYDGSFPASTPSFAQTALTIAGSRRDAWVYRPAGVVSPPLLVLFTGTGGDVENSLIDELGMQTVQDFADREGVVVVAPLPRAMTRGDWDNHFGSGTYWETATQEGSDSPVSSDANANPDLIFTRAVMDEAIRVYGVNPDRIYFNGFSNGAFFSYFAAAVLHERVAAFAETGGGLVLSNSTYGDPPCQVSTPPGASGEVHACSASGWTAQSCVSEGAIKRPIATSAVTRVPPAYLQANDDDDSVPFAHTCNLANALAGKTEVVARVVHNGGRHIWNAGFLQQSWDFMKSKSRPRTALTGLWWNPNESGWGMSLTQQGSVIFVAWYTYDAAGKPSWYVMSNCALIGQTCSGDIYSVAGGTQLTAPWNGAGKVVTRVGNGSIAFSGEDNAIFNYSVNGVDGVRSISRQVFATGSTRPLIDYSSLWWNAGESGWGVALTQEYGIIFAALYTYELSGKAIWYVASNCPVTGNGCSGELYEVTGGTAPSLPWNGSNKSVRSAGTVSFNFTDSGSGTMNYTINGVSAARAITRQPL